MTTSTNVFFSVIFDNGGGITLQTDDGFAHYYNDADQAATDVSELLNSADTSGWDGNEIEEIGTAEYDYDTERNGGYRWFDRNDVASAIKAGKLDTSWRNVRDFFSALGVDTTN